MHGLDSVMDLQLKSIDTLFMRFVFPFFWNLLCRNLILHHGLTECKSWDTRQDI
jgi:hypothetical protein